MENQEIVQPVYAYTWKNNLKKVEKIENSSFSREK
jgi:hypothetical protein